MTHTQLGKLIKSEREKRNWEQGDLASMISRGQQAISRWEKGNSRPTQDDLRKLVDLFSADEKTWMTIAGYDPEETDLSLASYLPLNTLLPDNFELFSRDLIKALNPASDVHRYGVKGNKQEGIDLFAKKEKQISDYQCKRHKQFGPADIREAVGKTTFKANHHYLVLSRAATSSARKEILNYPDWTLWDREDIAREIRNLTPDDAMRIVNTYFPSWIKRFLGRENPSPWLSPDDFYHLLIERSKLFSHGWSLVGRKNELKTLQEFQTQKDIAAILISGRGGIGKSRLLRAWTNGISKSSKIVFLSNGYEVRPADLELLPTGSGFLVIDDAHDRADIGSIINGVVRARPEIKIVLTSRPYGMTFLKDELTKAGIVYDAEKIITLNDLTTEEAKSLSEEILVAVNGDVQYASRIAEITKDCPLATVIGSRLVGEGQIQPELLNNVEKFRDELLKSFRNVITGQIGGSNAQEVLELLDFIAMIQPFNPYAPGFKESAEKVLNRHLDKIVRDIRALEEAGVLLKRGHRLRIVPDLLSDYIRAVASYDEKGGRPTGYADRVFNELKDDLATNLLLNMSQLDWRLSADKIQSSLLDEVWTNLKAQFKKAKIFERAAILEALTKVAYYQPGHALDFVKLALDEPTEEVEETYRAVSFAKPSYKNVVIQKLPSVLRYVAYHAEYLTNALDILKQLAEKDERSTNPHPDHPLRVLQDLASIEPGKPIQYNETVVNHALDWLRQNSVGKFSPFDVLDELLKTEGHTSESTRTGISMRAFKVRPEAVSNMRKLVVDAAFEALYTSPLKDGLRALKSIGEALRYPSGMLGQDITNSDLVSWEPGILDVLSRLEEVVKNKKIDPFIAVEALDVVSWHANYNKTSTTAKEAAKKVLSSIPTTTPHEVSRAIVDSWGWSFERDEETGRQSEVTLKNWRKQLVRKIMVEFKGNFPALIQMLEERVDALNKALSSRYPDAGPFLADLMEESLEFAEITGKHLLSNPESPLAIWFNVPIIVLNNKNQDVALMLIKEALGKNHKTLSQCVASALGWGLYDQPITDEEIEVVKQLALSGNPRIRKTIVHALERFSPEQKQNALSILLSIDLGESREIADEVLEEFDEKHGKFKISDLSKEQLQQLIASLVLCPSIDDYYMGLFLSNLSLSHPELTLKLMMDRIEYKEANQKIEGYDPIPFSWDIHAPLHFHETTKYEFLLRKVRDWATVKTDNWIRFHYGADLFELVSAGFDDITLKVLEEWIASTNEYQLTAAAALLSGAGRAFVWDKPQFVNNVLERAQKFGDACYKKVSSSLHTSTLKGGRSGIPGQPFPEDIEQRDRSYETMKLFPEGSPSHKFYKALYEGAKREIERFSDDDFDFDD